MILYEYRSSLPIHHHLVLVAVVGCCISMYIFMVTERKTLQDFPTFATISHQPPTIDDSNWVMRIDREASVW